MRHELLKILVMEKALVRLLRTIGDGKYHTRELLNVLREWGYGHKLLLKAFSLGLVKRERIKPKGKGNWRVYNSLTLQGKEVVKLADRIGI